MGEVVVASSNSRTSDLTLAEVYSRLCERVTGGEGGGLAGWLARHWLGG